jgi:hypothetical protein
MNKCPHHCAYFSSHTLAGAQGRGGASGVPISDDDFQIAIMVMMIILIKTFSPKYSDNI